LTDHWATGLSYHRKHQDLVNRRFRWELEVKNDAQLATVFILTRGTTPAAGGAEISVFFPGTKHVGHYGRVHQRAWIRVGYACEMMNLLANGQLKHARGKHANILMWVTVPGNPGTFVELTAGAA